MHASPKSNDEYIYEAHPQEEIISLLGGKELDALLMGHTHVSYIKQSKPLLINCGSVGRSKEADRKATYCLLTLSETNVAPEIIKVSYQIEDVATAIYQSAVLNFYADFLLNKLTRDT